MRANLIENPSGYSPTSASDETDITTFYNKISSLARHILKHNVLNISVYMDAQIDKNENNEFYLHNLPKRTGKYLTDFHSGLSCMQKH